ncbi:YbhB/YbcL family Raf kinase inhibitor-like protein [Burkholderia sp. A1]|uniref:YbhB/YbcL family Raf kinase inhibitor-like protein n=1 Tax=Burkholderia sp. A1 TaxID=148446 RepID=UPI000469D962|nr:YbhB/YbcL family Raf kinase inhibitor-like protein [Burkholderia sp. A1]
MHAGEDREERQGGRHRGRNALRLLAVVAAALLGTARPGAQAPFTLSSADLREGGRLDAAQRYSRDGCGGANRSPQLSWQHAPRGTRAYAITMFDPDAPGRGWWHWAVTGIPAEVTSLPANASASGVLRRLGASEARNDFGTDGYGGACPPPGKPHRYVITVYALDSDRLRSAQGRPAQLFDHEIGVSALAYARLTVTDER